MCFAVSFVVVLYSEFHIIHIQNVLVQSLYFSVHV